jgi:hypothetical protein
MSFEGLGLEVLEETSETSATPAPAAKPPVQVPQPVVPQQQQQPQAAPQAQPPQPAQAEAAPAQPAAQQTEAPSQPPTLDSTIDAFNQNLPAIADSLANEFVIDDVMAQELEADFRTAVPKLLSQVFTKAVHTNLQYMKQFIPQMIQQERALQSMYQEAEKKFFGKFTQLNAATHGKDIRAYGAAFVAQNPKLTQDELYNLVGSAVMAKHGILPGTQAPPKVPPNTPAAAFVPVGNSAPAAPPPAAGQDGSQFWGLGQDFDS